MKEYKTSKLDFFHLKDNKTILTNNFKHSYKARKQVQVENPLKIK